MVFNISKSSALLPVTPFPDMVAGLHREGHDPFENDGAGLINRINKARGPGPESISLASFRFAFITAHCPEYTSIPFMGTGPRLPQQQPDGLRITCKKPGRSRSLRIGISVFRIKDTFSMLNAEINNLRLWRAFRSSDRECSLFYIYLQVCIW